jgi:pimeloyl-ACP methyl ester carboxylesterase
MTFAARLRRLLSFAFAALLAGCAALPTAVTEQVGDRRLEYALVQRAAPPVVFENGLGGKLDWWAKVFPEISKEQTAFAYNRAGYGESQAGATPRDGARVVEELRGVLRAKGLAPPYVLVGHSLGGLYMQWYARRYPDEVAGLVLVDSTHPLQMKGKGAPEHWPVWLRIGFGIFASGAVGDEWNAINATGEDVLALPPLAGTPVIILCATDPKPESSELAADAHAKRVDLARLYPGARQVWVEGGHGIPREHPEAVIAAIREILAQVKSR